MPQKRNPDGMELVRGKAGVLSALSVWTKNVVRSLPTGYNRDVQETKEPMMRALDTTLDMLGVVTRTAGSVTVNGKRLAESFSAELLATDEVFKRVEEGASFRDAYREVAGNLEGLSDSASDPVEVIKRRTSTGSPGNLDLEPIRRELAGRRNASVTERERISNAVASLVGRPIALYSPADSAN